MATHSNILVWEIPWTEKPGGLQLIGLKELNTNEATEHTHIITEFLKTRKYCFKLLKSYLAYFLKYINSKNISRVSDKDFL